MKMTSFGGKAAVAFAAALVVLGMSQPAEAAKKKDLAYTALAMGVLTVITAGIGGTLLGVASLASSDADEAGDALAAKGYAQPCASDTAACQQIDDDLERRDDMTTGAIASFATAGAWAFLGVGFLIKGAADGTLASTVKVTPIVAERGGGAAVQVTF